MSEMRDSCPQIPSDTVNGHDSRSALSAVNDRPLAGLGEVLEGELYLVFEGKV